MAIEQSPTPPAQTEEAFEQFLDLLPEFSEAKQDEPVMASFYVAAQEAIQALPEFRSQMRWYVTSQADKPAPYLVNKLFKAGQASLIPDKTREHEDYPGSFHVAERWVGWLAHLVNQPDGPESTRFNKALISDDHKNRSGRAKAVAIAASMLLDGDVLHEGIVLHEPGASAMHVSKALAMGEVGKATIVTRLVGQKESFRDEAATIGFNGAARQVRLRAAYCIDLDPPPQTDEGMDQLKAFSLLPSELGRDREETFDKFVLAEPEAPITMIKDDFMDMTAKHRRLLLANPADVVFLSHMVSQNTEHLDDLLEKVLPFVKPRGHIVMNEYAIVSPFDGSITIHDDWSRSWQVVTAIAEARRPETGFVPFMQWENSHCETGMLYAEGAEKLSASHLVRGPY